MEGVRDVVKPVCHISGTERNIYAIIGVVDEALRREGHTNLADEFVFKAVTLSDYDEALALGRSYVEFHIGGTLEHASR